ncbi:hypothetical protein D3C73_847050 [compost metagenome]
MRTGFNFVPRNGIEHCGHIKVTECKPTHNLAICNSFRIIMSISTEPGIHHILLLPGQRQFFKIICRGKSINMLQLLSLKKWFKRARINIPCFFVVFVTGRAKNFKRLCCRCSFDIILCYPNDGLWIRKTDRLLHL